MLLSISCITICKTRTHFFNFFLNKKNAKNTTQTFFLQTLNICLFWFTDFSDCTWNKPWNPFLTSLKLLWRPPEGHTSQINLFPGGGEGGGSLKWFFINLIILQKLNGWYPRCQSCKSPVHHHKALGSTAVSVRASRVRTLSPSFAVLDHIPASMIYTSRAKQRADITTFLTVSTPSPQGQQKCLFIHINFSNLWNDLWAACSHLHI